MDPCIGTSSEEVWFYLICSNIKFIEVRKLNIVYFYHYLIIFYTLSTLAIYCISTTKLSAQFLNTINKIIFVCNSKCILKMLIITDYRAINLSIYLAIVNRHLPTFFF
jgi:hypothetical protein